MPPAAGLSSISDLDGVPKFSKRTHFEAAHASSLIYSIAAAEYAALSLDADWIPVAVTGNSLGWYTALHVAGAISFDAGLDIVIGTGGYQRQAGTVGGQLVFPVLDGDWQQQSSESSLLATAVTDALAAANKVGFASLSIDLGGLAVLAADDAGMAALKEALPTVSRSSGAWRSG